MSEHDPYECAASEADDVDMPPETAPTAAAIVRVYGVRLSLTQLTTMLT